MNVGKINSNKLRIAQTHFLGDSSKKEYENPVSRSTERNLAILSSVGGSAVVGAIVGGLSTCIGFKSKSISPLIGVLAGVLTLGFTLPANIYNTKVNAFAKQKEMDVFSRDRELKANLTEEVDKEVENPSISLDKKLDDNLKLQMANRANVVGIANMNTQSQPVVQVQTSSQPQAVAQNVKITPTEQAKA